MDQERIEHMRGIFTGPLLKFRESLLMMASLTDRNLTMALSALAERDDAKALLVESEDSVIDRLEIDLDEMVVGYIATHGAVATTCRLMLASSRISESLENIADQAVSIARRARQLNQLPEVPVDIDIPKAGSLVLHMIRDSIGSFVDIDPERAHGLIKKDKEVDELNRLFERQLNAYMMEHPESVTSCVHLMVISRSLERAGDSAKKIAEDVYYLYTAQDIRHEHAGGAPRPVL
jgi:phosphate transport system protein